MNGVGSRAALRYIAAMAIVCAVMFARSEAAFKFVREGMTAPSVEGVDVINGSNISSDSLIRENTVAVVFWATWSESSIAELNYINELRKRNNNHFHVIAVNVDNDYVTPPVKNAISRTALDNTWDFSVIIDNQLVLMNEYGVVAIPSMAIIDSMGALRFQDSGFGVEKKELIELDLVIALGYRDPAGDTESEQTFPVVPMAMNLYNSALKLAAGGKINEAMRDIDEAVKIDSTFSAPHNLMGQILLNTKEFNKTLNEFEIAVKLDSGSVAARAGLGRALLRSGRFEEAEAALAEALSLDDAYTPALLDLAICRSRGGDFPGAMDFLHRAESLNPRNPVVHYYLAEEYLRADRKADAAGSYRRLLEILFPPY